MVNFKNNSEVKILSLPAYLALGHEVFNFLNKTKQKKQKEKRKLNRRKRQLESNQYLTYYQTLYEPDAHLGSFFH